MNSKSSFFSFCLILINIYHASAFEQLPEPGELPPGPPEPKVSIDNHLIGLIIAGLILGIVFIYRNKIKKASM